MKVCLDIECNSLNNPTKLWVIVCKDIDTGELHVFRPETVDDHRAKFLAFSRKVRLWIGHNILGYDLPHLVRLVSGFSFPDTAQVADTLVISKLTDYSRPNGHSIEAYGEEFGRPKIKFNDWTKYSKEMEEYCVQDVEINHLVFNKQRRIINDVNWRPSIDLEQAFQLVVNALHDNGFDFNQTKALGLLHKVKEELVELDAKIEKAFPPREVLIKEFTPKLTKFGTISKTSVPRSWWEKIHELEAGNTYRHTSLVPFNPASHKQIIQVLHEAGWRPQDKTQTHIDTEREINRLKRSRQGTEGVDLETLCAKLKILEKFGWKINEFNLGTLPSSAPSPARLLAKRILLESRRRTLTEWLGLVQEDGRIHGQFQGIGAWTHRMAHQRPNTANIPNEKDTQGNKKLLGKEMRSLWRAPKNRLLVGVDAEGIQLRIFAHYINDEEFTDALVRGKKEDKSDPHSLNQRILGSVCKSRAAAKRFIYALLLGAGLWKLAQILECSEPECQEALDRLLQRYTGWASLKQTDIPRDAKRGYFQGLDGRKVIIPGETVSERKHLAMSGYLQNGEAIVMKKATLEWLEKIEDDNILLVNFVHDEWQVETPNNMDVALRCASVMAKSLETVGERLGLRCPLAGSYWNDDYKDYTIGTNWAVTH